MIKHYTNIYGSWQRALGMFCLAGLAAAIGYALLVGAMILGGAS